MFKNLVKEGPIFLLCVNCKIIAKIMGEIMKRVMHKVVFDDQIGFIPIWNINIENIIIFLEVQDYMHNSQKPMFVFLSYIEKSFEFCLQKFLQASIVKMNLESYFISWFLTLHNKSTTRPIINGFFDNGFNIYYRVRQGCPYALLFFLVAPKLLTCNIRNSNVGKENLLIIRVMQMTCYYVWDLCHKLKEWSESLYPIKIFMVLKWMKANYP
jgi:hypothetical protein